MAGTGAIALLWLGLSLLVRRGFILALLGDLSALVLLTGTLAVLVRNAWLSQHRVRIFWTVMAAGFFMWSFNQAAWFAYEIILRRNMPDPFFSDVILFMHVVPLIAAVALAPHSSEKGRGLYFSTVNFLLLIVWWVFLYSFVVFPDEYLWLRVPVYSRNFDRLYLFENLVLVLSLAIAARGSQGRWRELYGNMFGAAAVYTVASEAMNAAIARGSYYSGSIYDVPFLGALGWFLWTALRARKWTLEPEAAGHTSDRWVTVAPRLAMIAIISLPIMGLWALFLDDSPWPVRRFRIMVMLAATMVLSSFVFLKQYLLDHQLMHLLEETDRSFVNLQRIQTELVRKEKLASLGQLVAGAAHEINSPLKAILKFSEQLSGNQSLAAEQLSMAQKIGHHARRTGDLIADLLSFAQQNPADKSMVDLGALLQRAMHMEALRLESKNIRVETKIAPDLPRILGNQNQLFESCLQIISNAVDALDEVGGGNLVVSAYRENNDAVLEFSDTGPGIREPGKVFDPFYTTKPVGKGTGLGLSAAYGVVQNHDGQITCLNKPAGGALFILRFPAVAQAGASASS
jgi:signal transduction histidine kinase